MVSCFPATQMVCVFRLLLPFENKHQKYRARFSAALALAGTEWEDHHRAIYDTLLLKRLLLRTPNKL